MTLRSSGLDSLLKKAKELEKRYEWLQAAKLYNEASNSALDKKDVLSAAELQEKSGSCFHRAADQAKSNAEFRKTIKYSILAFEKESKILKDSNAEKHRVKINHANALAAYVSYRYETDSRKRKVLLDRWWNLENQVLKAYENSGDLYSVGKTCNDLSEYSLYSRFWLVTEGKEHLNVYLDGIRLAEKALKIFCKLNDKFELARAYWICGGYYGFSEYFIEDEDKTISLYKKSKDWLQKALELSKEIDNSTLIGHCFEASWSSAQFLSEPELAVENGEKAIKYGNITQDNYLLATGNILAGLSVIHLSRNMEDPDKQKASFQKAVKMAQQARYHFNIINELPGFDMTCIINSTGLQGLAEIETSIEKKQALLEESLRVIHEGLDKLRDWDRLRMYVIAALSDTLTSLSEIKPGTDEKRALLTEAKTCQEEVITFTEKFVPFMFSYNSLSFYIVALILDRLANLETETKKKVEMLNQAAISINKSLELLQKKQKMVQSAWASGTFFAKYYFKLGGILQKIVTLTNEDKRITEAIEAYETASSYFMKAKMPTRIAESNWSIAQLYDQLSNHQEASKNYELSAQSFITAAKNIPQLEEFYNDYSLYMRAWSQIEQARYSHSIEDYEEAQHRYKKAAMLHESTTSWSYLANNYSAWASMEEAEGLCRKENSQQAKQAFQKSFEQFSEAADSIKHKLEETTSPDEKEMMRRVFEASEVRLKYCEARILMEEAKLLDREGKHLQSSDKYVKAAQAISAIANRIDVGAERKELEYLAVLCRAWGKMADAEGATSSEAYLDAAEFFEEAKNYCFTRKASLWVVGNSCFCRGLAAGVNYQTKLDVKEHNKAKGYIKNAATNYLKAGYENASEYAKGTQRLFDAYFFMNQAERESETEKRVKQYQLTENLLQLAIGSFNKAKQPEKTEQVQQILDNVREEKELAISFNEVLQAPTIASSTSTFKAPTSTSETSIGLESFNHANIQANLVVGTKEVRVGESFCLTVEFVNAGKEPALLTRVEDFVPSGFVVVEKPEIYRLEDSCLNMKGKQIAPLKLVEAKLVLQPSKKGVYQLNPKAHYLDELGQNKLLLLKSAEIRVEEVILSNRVSTGTNELDALLLGGIPEECAVVLTGSPTDERESIIKNYLEAGTEDGHTSFYAATEAAGLENLLEKPNFYLFLCNPRPKIKVLDLPNVYKLHSKADINNLNIALVKAYRTVEQSSSKRICVNIVSDVLANYSMKTTRKWIAELTTDLISKGFTILAVINPQMHTPEELGSVLDLFDGEISLIQTEDPLECKKSIRIKKLRGQDFIKNPISLTKQ